MSSNAGATLAPWLALTHGIRILRADIPSHLVRREWMVRICIDTQEGRDWHEIHARAGRVREMLLVCQRLARMDHPVWRWLLQQQYPDMDVQQIARGMWSLVVIELQVDCAASLAHVEYAYAFMTHLFAPNDIWQGSLEFLQACDALDMDAARLEVATDIAPRPPTWHLTFGCIPTAGIWPEQLGAAYLQTVYDAVQRCAACQSTDRPNLHTSSQSSAIEIELQLLALRMTKHIFELVHALLEIDPIAMRSVQLRLVQGDVRDAIVDVCYRRSGSHTAPHAFAEAPDRTLTIQAKATARDAQFDRDQLRAFYHALSQCDRDFGALDADLTALGYDYLELLEVHATWLIFAFLHPRSRAQTRHLQWRGVTCLPSLVRCIREIMRARDPLERLGWEPREEDQDDDQDDDPTRLSLGHFSPRSRSLALHLYDERPLLTAMPNMADVSGLLASISPSLDAIQLDVHDVSGLLASIAPSLDAIQLDVHDESPLLTALATHGMHLRVLELRGASSLPSEWLRSTSAAQWHLQCLSLRLNIGRDQDGMMAFFAALAQPHTHAMTRSLQHLILHCAISQYDANSAPAIEPRFQAAIVDAVRWNRMLHSLHLELSGAWRQREAIIASLLAERPSVRLPRRVCLAACSAIPLEEACIDLILRFAAQPMVITCTRSDGFGAAW